MVVSSNVNTNGQELRAVVVQTLKDQMKKQPKLIALDADLGAASGWTALGDAFPRQFINAGIAEANMVGVAAGLSLTGYIPFIHTFGPFATRRVFDQLFLSGAYAGNTINIYGSDPGFTVGTNGGTHTTWEDVALMRTIPDAVICDAADGVQMKWIIEAFSQRSGIHYVRGNRKKVGSIYEEGTIFEIGKGKLLTSGKDILIVAAGQLVSDVLMAAEGLKRQGISSTIIDMFTIKPLDKALLLENIKNKKAVITVENHSITGGLGSAVAEVLAEAGSAVPLQRIGVDERFGQVGSPDFLQKEYGLTAADIEQNILAFI